MFIFIFSPSPLPVSVLTAACMCDSAPLSRSIDNSRPAFRCGFSSNIQMHLHSNRLLELQVFLE